MGQDQNKEPGYAQGYAEGKEVGRDAGLALAQLMMRMGDHAGAQALQKIAASVEKAAAGTNVVKIDVLNDLVSAMVSFGFLVGAEVMYRQEHTDLKHIDDIKAFITDKFSK